MIIGFSGKMNVGKTTMAIGLKEYIPNYTIRSFGTHLKECVKFTFGLTNWHVYTKEGKNSIVPELGITVRTLLQKFGTDFCRDMIHPDFWVMQEEKEIQKFGDIVYDDVRFLNEAQLIRNYGGVVIHLLRDFESEGTQKEQLHASEKLRAGQLDILLELPNDINIANRLVINKINKIKKGGSK